MEQVVTWAPDTIVTWDANFFAEVYSDPVWAAVPAVSAKRVFLAPRLPFGWIDAPPSINRTIGLRWIAALLYPDRFPQDTRQVARTFFKLFYRVEPDDAALDRVLAGAGPGERRR
jgi:iron complex transport system substrate-binding protein